MQWKSGPSKPMTAVGKDSPDFILHVKNPEQKELSLWDKYSAHLIFIALSMLLLIGIGLLPK